MFWTIIIFFVLLGAFSSNDKKIDEMQRKINELESDKYSSKDYYSDPDSNSIYFE